MATRYGVPTKLKAINLRSIVMATSALMAPALAAGLTQPAYAQTTNQSADSDDEDVVLVTGTRVRRPEFSQPIPVTSLNEQDIELAGVATLDSLLTQVPAIQSVTNSRESQNGTERSGVATVSLRGLGTDRTLTLVDGRRVVSSRTGRQQVDLSTIPTDFIERIEVLTGGASAIYGSDAMAGVVNIITRDSFDGLRVRGRGEVSQQGGEENLSTSITGGGDFMDGRGSSIFNVNFLKRYRLASHQRDFARIPLEISSSSGEITPDFSSFTPGGRYDLINTSGSRFGDRPILNEAGEAEVYSEDVNGANFNRIATISTPIERFSTAAKLNFTFDNGVNFFADTYYTRTETVSERTEETIQASEFTASDDNLDQIIPVTHPFFPQALLDFAADPETGDPGEVLAGVEWRRRLNELGGRSIDNQRQTFRVVGGLEGRIADNWDWELAFSHGESFQAQLVSGNTIVNNVKDALDIEPDPDNPGEFRCRDGQARERGCVPLNIFGVNSITPEAAAWIKDSSLFRGKLEQNVITAVMSGELMELPAGPLGVAIGGEYRTEKSRTDTDSIFRDQGTTFVAVPSNGGRFNVKEFFTEINVPLISGAPLIEYLGADAAVRVADYSLEGTGTVTSYKFGGEWAPTQDLRFRGGYSKATRAPNIIEAFSVPRTTAIGTPDDPCDGLTAADTGVLADNCRSFAPIDAVVSGGGTFVQDTDLLFRGFNLGNENLMEETANTFTMGGVWQPEAVPGLGLTVDYYNIKIEDAIVGTNRNVSVDVCYASVGLSSPDCALVFRDGNGQIFRVDSQPRNEDSLNTSGLDVFLRYNIDLDELPGPFPPGEFNVTTNYTHVFVNEIERIVDPLTGEIDVDDENGEIEDPRNRARVQGTYNNGRFSATWRSDIRGNTNTGNAALAEAIADGDHPNAIAHRTTGVYILHHMNFGLDFGANDQYRVNAGINNLFNRNPPLIPDDIDEEADRDSACNSNCSVFDPVGRSFYLSFTANF